MEEIQDLRERSKSLSIIIIDLELEIVALQETQEKIRTQLENLTEINNLEKTKA